MEVPEQVSSYYNKKETFQLVITESQAKEVFERDQKYQLF